jgi:hypothetical protein
MLPWAAAAGLLASAAVLKAIISSNLDRKSRDEILDEVRPNPNAGSRLIFTSALLTIKQYSPFQSPLKTPPLTKRSIGVFSTSQKIN